MNTAESSFELGLYDLSVTCERTRLCAATRHTNNTLGAVSPLSRRDQPTESASDALCS
ncbi:hypothetical protein J6590_003262 [Homalodisca vitripennis]|nr:hypothetical protein J6590_003262 [Homalodisca vitripennis]